MFRIGLLLVLATGLLKGAFANGLEKGVWEMSGMGSWAYSDDSGLGEKTLTTELLLTPALLAYPSRYLFLGPILGYTRTRTENEHNNSLMARETLTTRWDLGLKVGILANWSDERCRPLPYLGASVGLSAMSLDIDEADTLLDDTRLSENGHFFAGFLGVKLRLSESFYLNFQPTLSFAAVGEREIIGFHVGTGFSGTF